MKKEKLNLPKSEHFFQERPEYMVKDWIMDPSPFFLERFPDEVVTEIYAIRMKAFAEILEVNSKVMEINANMCRKIAEAVHPG